MRQMEEDLYFHYPRVFAEIAGEPPSVQNTDIVIAPMAHLQVFAGQLERLTEKEEIWQQ